MQKLKIRSHFKVTGFKGSEQLTKRLKELGIQEQEQIYLQAKILFGGPYIVRFKNTHIALRKEELECLRLQAIE